MSCERRSRDQLARVRAQVRVTVPEGSRVLVMTRGDESLLRLGRRDGEHFPQSPTGLYAGHYPADGEEAAGHLAELRADGAEYLVIPAEARWWLEHYPELGAALEEDGELLASDAEAAEIYALSRSGRGSDRSTTALEAARIAAVVGSLVGPRVRGGGGVALIGLGAEAVELDDRPCWRLPSEPVEPAIAQARAACREGARFVVLLHPESKNPE